MPPTAVPRHSATCAASSVAERGEALRAQDRALGVDVVLRRGTARERHLADHERVLAQQLDESRAGLRRAHSYVRPGRSRGAPNLAL